jgi:uncharacterized membrane-anchored protein
MKRLLLLACCFFAVMPLSAQEIDSAQIFYDSVEASLGYQTGEVKLGDSIGTLNIPKGFKFLGPEDAQKVLHELWGNPENPSILGMIVQEREELPLWIHGRSPYPSRTWVL